MIGAVLIIIILVKCNFMVFEKKILVKHFFVKREGKDRMQLRGNGFC